LKHDVVALAKAAKTPTLPIVVTTTARDGMWGPTFPELVDALPGIEIIDRSSVNAFDDARLADAIEATGRKKLTSLRAFRSKSARPFPPSPPLARATMPMSPLTPRERSARLSGKSGCCACFRPARIVSDYATPDV
jgi:hypothetical protein